MQNEKANRKPKIGVMPLFDEEKDSYWMLPGYLESILKAGGLPVTLPAKAEKEDYFEIDQVVDGYLFTGGHDISPKMYGEEKRQVCGNECKMRDQMEEIIYKIALEKNKPVLGICRGIQMINVLEGGTLYQDLPFEYTGTYYVEHHMRAPYDRTIHSIVINENTPLYHLLNKRELKVNSYHHQAVRKIGKNLEIMAISEDGIVEAVYRPDKKFIWGIQWHPEFIYEKDENAFQIVKKFITSCKEDE